MYGGVLCALPRRLRGRSENDDTMKIAVWHNLSSGGAKRALYYQVKGLVERGHHVECWSPSTADEKYLPLGELAPEHTLPMRWVKDDLLGTPLRRAKQRRKMVLANLRAIDEH